ncbi:MAG: AzlD domain-containing protein [Clostridia bacterium]|nr:AzlD domain-containing protein [Clostridia bacterium]
MNNIYIYMFIMAAVTYLIRMLPLALIKKKITNKFFKSFLYYVPFVTLAVMTFPAILDATENVWSALAAFVVSMITAYAGGGLPIVAGIACVVVFVVERFV